MSWCAQTELDFRQWIEHGQRLGVAGRGAGWWIGDWVRYGAARYGAKYARAARVTGYDHQTLMNMVYVASRFEISRRRENLSWSHHAEVAALEPEEQDHWLDRAQEERLSVRRLRQELAHRAAAPARPDEAQALPADDRHGKEAVVCPQCGYHIADSDADRGTGNEEATPQLSESA